MLTYLAGPINGCSDEEVFGWRRQAANMLGRANVVDPTVRDYRGSEDRNVARIVEGDLADIDGCGAVLAYCWSPSYGTAMEIMHAHRAGKKVVTVVSGPAPVSPWLRYHSHHVTRKLDDAVGLL